eukprot:180287_1
MHVITMMRKEWKIVMKTQNIYVDFQNKDKTRRIKLHSYNICSKSDVFDTKYGMMGIVIYQYDNKTEWNLNGIKCKSGFIYLCHSYKLNYITSYPINTMHA